MTGSDVFSILAKAGYYLVRYMSEFFALCIKPISDLLPTSAMGLLGSVPILDEFLAYSLLDILAGAGLIVFIGYTIVKWLIP